MNIDGKRIVITGAASGIGRALLHEMAAYPATIVAADRHAAALRSAADVKARATIHTVACDVSTQAGVESLFDHAQSHMGGIDLFIANAGFAYYEQIGTPDWGHVERIFQANVISAIYSATKMRALYGDTMYKMVMVASSMGLMAIPGYSLYAATKAALDRFADGYRFELGDPRKLMLVYPIGTRTDFFRTSGGPETFPLQTPAYVARRIVAGIKADRKAVVPSPSFIVLRLLNRVIPVCVPLFQQLELWRFRRWLRSR